MEKRRVVITGMGAITPYGIGVDKFWNGVKNGESCITKAEDDSRLTRETHTTLIYGVVDPYDESQYMDVKEAKRLDNFIKHALVASEEAIKNSGLDMEKEDAYRVGCIVSAAAGGFQTIEDSYKKMLKLGYTKCSPFTIPHVIVNMPSGKVAIKYGIKGLNKVVVSACATATHSIGDAYRSIQFGDADVIIAGGTEAVTTNLGIGAFSALRALSKRNDEPTKASRPFDKDRDGFVMSEGAGVIVVEELEHAKARGANILAEIVGYGQTCDAYDLVAPEPNGEGAAKAMEFALKDAELSTDDIDYINAHGTSTHVGDLGESLAVAKVFGDLDKNKHLMISSTKSMHGHMLGAAGGIESIVCVKAMQDGVVPPTINLDNQDPEVANLNYVPNKPVNADLKYTMSNSFGFGGHNASLVFKKYEG